MQLLRDQDYDLQTSCFIQNKKIFSLKRYKNKTKWKFKKELEESHIRHL